MAKKQPKIKRYRKIYGGRSTLSRVVGAVLTVVMLAGVAFLGWTLYEPVSDFLDGTMSLPESSQQEIAPVPTVDLVTVIPQLPQTEITDPAQIKGAYLPAGQLQDPAALTDKLKSLQKQGFNAIVIDAKDADGKIRYQTRDENAVIAGAQAEDAIDLAELTKLAKEYRLSVVARLYAFKDHTAGLTFTGWAVKYMDTEMLWLDNSKEKGGRSWLNPYSEEAQMYIAELAMECISQGCEAILLGGVQFPEGLSLDLIGYGPVTTSRDQVLSAFVQDMDELIREQEAFLILSSSTPAMLGQQTSSHQNGALTYPVATVAPDLRPSAFANASLEGVTAQDPEKQPAETVSQGLALLREKAAEKAILPILQGQNADGSGYGAQQMQAQIEALTSAGIDGYILYSENGDYPEQ